MGNNDILYVTPHEILYVTTYEIPYVTTHEIQYLTTGDIRISLAMTYGRYYCKDIYFFRSFRLRAASLVNAPVGVSLHRAPPTHGTTT